MSSEQGFIVKVEVKAHEDKSIGMGVFAREDISKGIEYIYTYI
jgi:hypothetical protein